ncbi:hypothetical protein SCHPADRAFT_733525 [Schizopora paradoxa]|uniref:Uncharacterized protein n=1 Tax=Schizopora paradoxa TaxID=27342 RepID=A0A0H2R0E7_9AGAM|nr:hypothetical protein SCHPADRAFT_733525 [Schizopora paradoxa]
MQHPVTTTRRPAVPNIEVRRSRTKTSAPTSSTPARDVERAPARTSSRGPASSTPTSSTPAGDVQHPSPQRRATQLPTSSNPAPAPQPPTSSNPAPDVEQPSSRRRASQLPTSSNPAPDVERAPAPHVEVGPASPHRAVSSRRARRPRQVKLGAHVVLTRSRRRRRPQHVRCVVRPPRRRPAPHLPRTV